MSGCGMWGVEPGSTRSKLDCLQRTQVYYSEGLEALGSWLLAQEENCKIKGLRN